MSSDSLKIFFFLFLTTLVTYEVPRPGIESDLQQLRCQILSPLCHSGNSYFWVFIPLAAGCLESGDKGSRSNASSAFALEKGPTSLDKLLLGRRVRLAGSSDTFLVLSI